MFLFFSVSIRLFDCFVTIIHSYFDVSIVCHVACRFSELRVWDHAT